MKTIILMINAAAVASRRRDRIGADVIDVDDESALAELDCKEGFVYDTALMKCAPVAVDSHALMGADVGDVDADSGLVQDGGFVRLGVGIGGFGEFAGADLDTDIPCEQLANADCLQDPNVDCLLANADCLQDPRCDLEGRLVGRGKTFVRCVFRDAQSTCNLSLSDNWNSRFLQCLFKSQRQFRENSTFFL